MKRELLNAIAYRDSKSEIYEKYLKKCLGSPEKEEQIDCTYDEGCRAWEEQRYDDAIDLFEETLVCGRVEAIYPLMRLYQEILDFYEGAEEWSYRVYIAEKVIQYNRIIENELQKGNFMW